MGDPSRVEILFLDVDGILTDGCIYMGGDGTELKRFSIRDGLGIKVFMDCGHKVALISGHASEATIRRFSRLGVQDIHVGVQDKGRVFDQVLAKHGLTPEQAAAMGDDLVDLPMLRRAAFAATVPDAHPAVREIVDHVTRMPAGLGAVREVIEIILEARGLQEGVLQRYLA